MSISVLFCALPNTCNHVASHKRSISCVVDVSSNTIGLSDGLYLSDVQFRIILTINIKLDLSNAVCVLDVISLIFCMRIFTGLSNSANNSRNIMEALLTSVLASLNVVIGTATTQETYHGFNVVKSTSVSRFIIVKSDKSLTALTNDNSYIVEIKCRENTTHVFIRVKFVNMKKHKNECLRTKHEYKKTDDMVAIAASLVEFIVTYTTK
jgi:hypothetical protein